MLHNPYSMTPPANQDDYYAQVKNQGVANADDKKPLKLKLKAVIKKPSEETPIESPREDSNVAPEKPKARLVEREHASSGLMKSVMKSGSDTKEQKVESREQKSIFPKISFGKAETKIKVLENRPVMQIPDEVPKRRTESSGSTGTPGQKRLRDDAKPMFQRNIGFSTPSKDGTAKKSGKWGKWWKDYTDQDGKKRSVKTIGGVADDGSFRRSGKMKGKKAEKNLEDIAQILVDRTGQEVSVPDVISVKEFSDKIGVPVAKVIGELMKNGVLVNLNAPIDYDTAFLIGEAFGITITKEISEDVSVSDLMDGNIEEMIREEDSSKLIDRSPIISVMGHVDHGKTSLLDYIRKTDVASGEAGGITQKIWAYQVEKNGKKITFLDTPGHEAFTIMRARGAKLTDIAIIVVAADEGMKPQTVESINHAKEAGVPIIVVINKMDKPGANIDLIKWQMAEQGIQPEDWGGTTVVCPVSAHTGLGMDALLEMILLQSEMLELRANPDRAWVATVIEAHLDQKLGSVATLLINTGTLRKWDNIVCAGAYGKIRTLKDYKGRNIEEALPWVPVQITGLSEVVAGGDILQSVSSSEVATTRAKEFSLAKNTKSIHAFEWASLAMLMGRLKSGALKQLKIVLKTDSGGSLEALKAALAKLSTPETQVTFIHSAIGDVNQSDVMMAGTSQGLLIAYNVGVLPAAKAALSQSKIEFIDKKVIYHVLEKVESIITGMIDIRYEEQELGTSLVKAIFYTGKNNSMMIVGMGVTSGKIENRAKVRVIRGEAKVGSGEVANLKMGPLDVIEVEEGNDCGINFKGDVTIMEGDKLEFYKMVQRK
jgi:translation initiation factor IF-2